MGEKMTLLPCPFCGHAELFDQWPCEWLDGSGVNVVRCPMCHGAAPEKCWNRRHLTQPAQAVDVGAIASRLRGASDAAYCDYIRQLRTTECLGWESKVSGGKFGRAELDAHNRAHEMLGRHRALSEVVAILTTAAIPNANGKEGVGS